MPRKVFTAGEVLAAADVNSFLMDQSVLTFTDSTARESAISTAVAPAGLVTYLEDTDAFEYWNGTAYEAFGGAAAADSIEFLVVAGGGGGAGELGGGGGAGGYKCSVSGETSGGTTTAEFPVPLQVGADYFVQIGAGGAGGPSSGATPGVSGNSTIFETVGSVGGGGGGRSTGNPAKVGGSGGGASNRGVLTGAIGAVGTFRNGFKGGDAILGATSGQNSGGGGGGGALGADGVVNGSGGNGGAGLSSSITGSSVTRAGGGGGARGNAAGTNGSGGAGGGGDGGAPGVNGTANTGGGGGGGEGNGLTPQAGGSGGSGIVILKYPDTFTITIGAGLTGTTDTSSVPDFAITTITVGTGNVSWAAA